MTTALDPHEEEPAAATPMNARTGAALDKMKLQSSGPINLQSLDTALGKVNDALTTAINYENQTKNEVSKNKASLIEAMQALPEVKHPEIEDSTKTVTTLLAGMDSPDAILIFKALELANSVINPSALAIFVDKMGNHITTRSAAMVKGMFKSVDDINGMRALIRTKL